MQSGQFSIAYNTNMESTVAQRILALNYQFYQSFASDFSETRGRVQPGVMRVLDQLPSTTSILDLGCGNGQLARQLAAAGFRGSYLGTDFSPALLEEASREKPATFQVEFTPLNLAQEDWSASLPGDTFEVILCFAALHHIPSRDLRLEVVRNIHRNLDERGKFYLSNWQFLKSERFRSRTLDWDRVGLSEEDVEEGDYLLDWRRGGSGIRYLHHFTPEELTGLAEKGGFKILESFYSDGKEGDLSLYQVWEPL